MELKFSNFPEAYVEGLWAFRTSGKMEHSRNGPVLTIPDPVTLTIQYPRERVITDPVRNANPFFHVMEVVWMFAGQKNVEWIAQFNSGMRNYANEGKINGAYGHRWLVRWGDQIGTVVDILSNDPDSRQAVITMWDPVHDFAPHWKDRPCNTHVYFRVRDGWLDMTVCNRSNDYVWGMMGANAVHLTYLFELIAAAVGLGMGRYRVFTNNLHFYTDLYPNGPEIYKTLIIDTIYPWANSYPILHPGEDLHLFLRECGHFVRGDFNKITCKWLKYVALPMHETYMNREKDFTDSILADDWQIASKRWLARNRG
jgi:hypothetical protein